uniref:CBS domain-containing protein n=1 Tax=Proteiniclasticum ruminis TaxID=398199 RepID=UPI0028B0F2EF
AFPSCFLSRKFGICSVTITLVKDLMIRDFAFAHAQDSIVDLLRVVDDNSISEIPILSEEGNLMGLVTENSLVTTLSQQYFEEGEVI